MDWITGIQRAIDYIEAHLNDELDYDVIAREAFSSSFHFQRVFSILCGYTLGEYIRYRRLSVAGSRLASGSDRVVDVALEFGYDSPDSFAKAFRAFHGITPSQARGNGAMLRSFSRLNIKVTLEGGNDMQYKLEEKPAMLLTGFKRRFSGDPNDKKDQDHYFACETRLEQYVLEGKSRIHDTIFTVMTNFGDNGYDYYIAYQLPKWARTAAISSADTPISSRYCSASAVRSAWSMSAMPKAVARDLRMLLAAITSYCAVPGSTL